MLSSSFEYIKALREGKYLLFLKWIDFITNKYELMNADDTVNFLIYDWLNHGCGELDVQNLAVLCAVHYLEEKALQGKLDYALQSITIALFICMVFQKKGLQLILLPEKDVSRETVNQLVEEKILQLNPFTYKELLEDMQSQFYQRVNEVDKKEVADEFQKIYAITKPRYLLEEYILYLERLKLKDDALYITRLSMANRLLVFLYEQTEMNLEVSREIAHYVNALRELHAGKEELDRLDSISPPSILENTWRWVAGAGITFFHIFLKNTSLSELISEKATGTTTGSVEPGKEYNGFTL
ncbi:Uncharacterised protein [Legionella wadsworthii]|uniref:Uncharacterized protein n=1 Tax=Legionella wadsworthii TaxID=28088 RepID=A0A378LWV1_9GAMM|nr:helical bundle domain-containing protein [Legionella wadsworthii]STY30762.1 Uncharacterised protein [Legionella wadsworthii]